MTPEQEITGLRTLLDAWRADSQRYESGLRDVRKLAMQHYDASDFESDNWLELIAKINAVLAHDNQCGVCGDHHEGDVPFTCANGDGE
ncbi:hypothetical protein [Zavarzinella formosa]|uniref:hypothetical protein n=1 Tax=Zavarzinella formosa TaxID=360055 RepID=UPI00035E113B|nr:hypothetical protein [Zavarzinella formosa]